MSLAAHTEAVVRLLTAWEANVHASLGPYPEAFRESLRAEAGAHLANLGRCAAEDLAAVRRTNGALAVEAPTLVAVPAVAKQSDTESSCSGDD